MRHIAIITKAPVNSGHESIPDGGITGNGDLCAILGGTEKSMRVHLAKCDLWCGSVQTYKNSIKPLGFIEIPLPWAGAADYRCEQDMDNAELRVFYARAGELFTVTVRVNKTENSVTLEAPGFPYGEPTLHLPENAVTGQNDTAEKDGLTVISRVFDGEGFAYRTAAYAAMKRVDANRYYIAAATNHDGQEPEKTVTEKASRVTAKTLEKLKAEHDRAWKTFWSASTFTVTDAELENDWYASQYYLAVCTGSRTFAPGLYGNFITVETPSWGSDYHLNYNYQAPFYAACSSNHPEFTDCYHIPLEEFLPRAREDAKRFGCRGVFFPVGLAPKGLYSEDDKKGKYRFQRLYMGQMSCAVHAADILVFRWKTTRDLDYARRHAFPFIKEVLTFFEDYAVYEDGRYSILKDAAHEVPYYRDDFTEEKYKKVINDKNNLLTLGVLRITLEAGIDMSETLGEDEAQREKWREMLNKLSPFPTYIRHGKRVFRYTESGMAWNDSNDIGLQHIFPGSCIGLSSDKRTLETARNSFFENGRWFDGNSTNSFYPCAARLGIDAELITDKLKEHDRRFRQENMLYYHGGGCLENCSTVADTLNEMALQSFEGVIRIFPDWNNKLDCRYENLRAYGAFLVSASVKNGKTGDVRIFSEKGEKLKIYNPFPCSVVTRPTEKFETAADIIIFDTVPGETITISEHPVGSAH